MKRSRILPIVLVAGFGLVLTGFAAWTIREKENREIRSEFRRRSRLLVSTVERGLYESRIALEDVGALFGSSSEVDAEEFGRFAHVVLARRHGIHALEWIPVVSGESRNAFIAKARSTVAGFTDITERSPSGELVSAGKRDQYFPVYFVEPRTGNEQAIGFDLHSDPVRRVGLIAARDQGHACATAPVRLVQERGDQLGMLVFQPVYRHGQAITTQEARRRNLVGLALCVFRLHDLIASTIKHIPERSLDLVVVDTTDAEPMTLAVLPSDQNNSITRSHPAGLASSELTYKRDIVVAGRTWTLSCLASRCFPDPFLTWNPWAALVAGIVLSGTIATYLSTLLGRAAHVQDLVEARTWELQKATQRAEASDRAKNTFLGNVSHEIRTPIMAITSAAELMLGNGSDTTDLSLRDVILRNGRHLTDVVDDLLDTSRVGAGKLDVNIADHSLRDILVDIRALAVPTMDGHEIEFRIIPNGQLPRRIRTDDVRLKQALINLINNAYKNTQSGHVHLCITAPSDGDQSRLIFRVEDTGRGIAAVDFDRIFEPFTQIESRPNTISDGMGLGLPLARSIATRLGGHLRVSSCAGQGTTFEFEIPVGSCTDSPRLALDDLDEDTSTPSLPSVRLVGRILLAEDFADTRTLLQEAFRRAGAQVTAVVDGREAVRVASEQGFDLMVLDIQMPVMDGLSAAVEMRKRGCLTPIVALTASVEPNARSRLLNGGFDDVWFKPKPLRNIIEAASAYLPTENINSDLPIETRDQDRLRIRMEEAQLSFDESLNERLKRLRAYIVAQDVNAACEALHQLVGSAGIHGRMPLSQEAARLLERQRGGSGMLGVQDLHDIEELARVKPDR